MRTDVQIQVTSSAARFIPTGFTPSGQKLLRVQVALDPQAISLTDLTHNLSGVAEADAKLISEHYEQLLEQALEHVRTMLATPFEVEIVI